MSTMRGVDLLLTSAILEFSGRLGTQGSEEMPGASSDLWIVDIQSLLPALRFLATIATSFACVSATQPQHLLRCGDHLGSAHCQTFSEIASCEIHYGMVSFGKTSYSKASTDQIHIG